MLEQHTPSNFDMWRYISLQNVRLSLTRWKKIRVLVAKNPIFGLSVHAVNDAKIFVNMLKTDFMTKYAKEIQTLQRFDLR